MRYGMMTRTSGCGLLAMLGVLGALGCSSNDDKGAGSASALDPDTAPAVEVDRFSDAAGMLQVRSKSPSLPAAGKAVDFDSGPFITSGLGPDGGRVRYYNFDVQPTQPAPIYAFFHAGETAPIAGQLNVVDVIPGEPGYNDFWQVMKVTVPADYVANSATSLAEIQAAHYPVESTDSLVNCPVVPEGSTAKLRLGGTSPELTRGWYRDQVVYYFNFDERSLTGSKVPVAPIYVSFNINPNLDGGGPPSGFKMESGSAQTHNVLSALPSNDGYSPLWGVDPYDNTDFDAVTNLATVKQANVLANDVANVNCPVVDVGG
jgi:hypothetical protein